MKPMVEIIGTLTQAMGGLDQTAKDDIFRRIFGADAIRAASILASQGVDGFTAMREAMASALPVGEKYKMVMSGLAGSAQSVFAGLQRLSIAVSDAVTPALANVVPFVNGLLNGLTDFASSNQEAVASFAKFAVLLVPAGAALAALLAPGDGVCVRWPRQGGHAGSVANHTADWQCQRCRSKLHACNACDSGTCKHDRSVDAVSGIGSPVVCGSSGHGNWLISRCRRSGVVWLYCLCRWRHCGVARPCCATTLVVSGCHWRWHRNQAIWAAACQCLFWLGWIRVRGGQCDCWRLLDCRI
jgi:hypothetical protein